MATVIDLLRHLGQHAAPDGDNALAGPITLPGVTDSALSLPLPPAIITTWARLVGRSTLGHHALALSAAQTQHSVALMGHGASPHDDLLLLVLSQLGRPPQRAMLYITPHGDSTLRTRLITLVESLGVRWLDAAKPGVRIGQAQLIVATPTDLHRRVLRYHDRAWRWLWSQIRFVALPELHGYTDVEAGHLHWLLRRVERLASHAPLQILTSLAPVADVGARLAHLLDRPLQVVAAPDGPSHSTLIALWRCGSDRAGTITRLAEQLTARRLAVTVLGRDNAETRQLQDLVKGKGIALPHEARVAIVAGIPRAIDDRQSLLRSGYRLLLLLAGDEPHELLFAAQPDLLLNALPRWPQGTSNPYIVAPQLLCAAVERPLEEAEIDRWSLLELRDRLIKKGTLQPLPSGDLWQAAPDIDDAYAEIDLCAISGPSVAVLNPAGQAIDSISPALLDRCALPQQVFEPGLRVAQRDERAQTVQLTPDPIERATIVLAEMAVKVREELAARSIRFGKQTRDLIKGKVLVNQQIVGLRELRPDGTQQIPRRVPHTEWLAVACWIPLAAPAVDPQTIGWTIAQVLPLVTLARPAAIAPAYDAANQRLYLIETEPGGVGIIDCIYQQFETVIELALQLAQAAASRPLYTQLAASELAWLHRLYGRAAPVEPERTSVAQPVPQLSAERKEPQPAIAITQPTPRTTAPTPQPKAQLSQPVPTAATQQPKAQPSQPVPTRPAEPNVSIPARTTEPQPSVRVPAAQAQTRQAEPRPNGNGQASTQRPIPADQRPVSQQPAAPARPNSLPAQPRPRPTINVPPAVDQPASNQAQTPRIEPETAPPVALPKPAATVVPTKQAVPVEPIDRPATPATPERRVSVYAASKPAPVPQPAPRADVWLEEPNKIEDAPQDRTVQVPVTPTPAQAAPEHAPIPSDAGSRVEQPAEPPIKPVDQQQIAPVPLNVQNRVMQAHLAVAPNADARVHEPATDEPSAPIAASHAEQKPIEAVPQAPKATAASTPTTSERRDQAPTPRADRPSAQEQTVERRGLPPAAPERPKDTGAPEPRSRPEAPRPQPPAPDERRRSAAQYRIEDLLPPVDDEDEADAAFFDEEQDETRIEQRPSPAPQPDKDRGWRHDRQQPVERAEAAGTQEADETDEADDLPPIRRGIPPRSETQPQQRRTPQPARPERPAPREPQRPFADRKPGRYTPGGPQRQREQPAKSRSDQQPYQSRNAPSQPPSNQQRRGPTPTNQRAPVEPAPPRPRQPVPPSRDETSKPHPQRAQQPAAPEPEADVNAMIARMRRLRQERETAQQQAAPRPARTTPTEQIEPRFHIGDRVQCSPYGTGTVRASRIVGGREQVMIHFPEYGEIEVDPALNLIRPLDAVTPDEQDEPDE